jgi:hypothetical protein
MNFVDYDDHAKTSEDVCGESEKSFSVLMFVAFFTTTNANKFCHKLHP